MARGLWSGVGGVLILLLAHLAVGACNGGGARHLRVPMREVSHADIGTKTKTPLDRVPMRETSHVDLNHHQADAISEFKHEDKIEHPHKVLSDSDENPEETERRWLDEIGDVGEVIGVGSFSVVHAAKNLTSNELLAIKMVKVPEDNEIFVKRLKREITILRAVDHPNIIKLKHVFEAPGKVNMVMERCVGGELFNLLEGMEFEEDGTRNWVPQEGAAFAFTDDLVVDIIYQILSAVDYMHKRRIVHRDLKLENVLLDQPYKQSDEVHQVTVVDFGFSKVLREGELLFSACGSPHYAAPEVISAKEKNVGYGLEVDMWAVGVITYTLLCCQYPFDGENDAEVIKRVLAGEFCFPDHVTISPEAQDFVRSLITVSREQRATAAECLEHPWITAFTTDRLRQHKRVERCSTSSAHPTVLRSASGGGPILGVPDDDAAALGLREHD